MYNKIKKCFDMMAIEYREMSSVKTKDGFSLSEGFLIKRGFDFKHYVEIVGDEINVWSFSDKTELRFLIKSQNCYTALFELGTVLERL